ncbi:MAG: Glu/Leu/Phe/Val dehydrogenase [Deltaproteobacteria bacterium]|jgi:glutamate dehydrogenase/leucine dehydrogenase|nr:Glu/Leu/Phe/Val dehydrogenase [Deltaproteobacteria bacterium]MBW2533535.1 Glu/Leu/Phe/Val dehydrogenase [Deltaproteobacteria bacterium]
MDLWSATPEQLRATLVDAGQRRAYLITHPKTGKLSASHDSLASFVRALREGCSDYHGHQAGFFEIGAASGHLLTAWIHKTVRGQAAGGVRLWPYDHVEGLVRDGLRLSRGMGHKNALAGLWWGGGKGVIARRADVDHRDPEMRRKIYQDYGRFMTGLCGCYVTAEDAGTTADDMGWIFSTTRHTTCIAEAVGGSGNPSVLTAKGVVVAMEAALHALDQGSLEGKTVVMQGLGNVSYYMIGDLLERRVARIIGSDIDEAAIEKVRRRYGADAVEARLVAPGDETILGERCDVLAPNGLGAILNASTIPTIRAAVVCGAANNQLEQHDRDAPALAARGVLYVPDFLANRMGIVNCANEAYGSFDGDPAIWSHLDREAPHGIWRRALEVFDRAKGSGRTPADEAQALADELAEEPHPIWGNRSQLIIDALVREGWAEQPPLEPR